MPQTNDIDEHTTRIYDDEGDLLVQADRRSDRVILLPHGDPKVASRDRDRIRIMWGQQMLADLVGGRYRTVVCGVNHEDNARGIIGELIDLIDTSQWSTHAATQYARMIQDSVGVLDASDREPYVVKYDLDQLLILALLRPRGRDHFTLDDIARGFKTINKMLRNRHDRRPVASVSFLGAKSNRLVGPDGDEPSFESVLRVMYEAGYRGDVYPSLHMWNQAPTGVFASYPFPASVDLMRKGGF